MSEIDWSLAPEGAVKLRLGRVDSICRWFNANGEAFGSDGWFTPTIEYKTIAIRPQQKTVADAYEHCKTWQHQTYGYLYWYEPIGFVYRSSPDVPSEYQLICTRQQFEAYAKGQEGGKWTHYVEDDETPPIKCKKHIKLCSGNDWVYVCEKGDYFVPSKMGFCSVKPIKPTISKAEAWDYAVDSGLYASEIEDKYDIT